jgi:glyoxylase-like metal-dependent hydrolase (beta-lactamase superfamily II)
MEQIKIIPIRAGVGQVFLVNTNAGFFIVDSGTKGYENKVIKAITSRGLNLKDLRFIFLTHAHYDHAGGAAALKRVSGTKLIAHELETVNLSDGYTKVPPGTDTFYKVLSFVGKHISKNYSHFPSVEPDITFNMDFDLAAFGISGKLIHTPGHTAGSSSLIIQDHAFVGDCLFNMMRKIYPPFANDEKSLLKSWEKLLQLNIEWYYPAHGKRLHKEDVRKEYARRIQLK